LKTTILLPALSLKGRYRYLYAICSSAIFTEMQLMNIHQRWTARPPCVNGDIAIQLEWSNFDPSQHQNPLTDYNKTLHNWLRPRDERATQNLCQSAV